MTSQNKHFWTMLCLIHRYWVKLSPLPILLVLESNGDLCLSGDFQLMWPIAVPSHITLIQVNIQAIFFPELPSPQYNEMQMWTPIMLQHKLFTPLYQTISACYIFPRLPRPRPICPVIFSSAPSFFWYAYTPYESFEFSCPLPDRLGTPLPLGVYTASKNARCDIGTIRAQQAVQKQRFYCGQKPRCWQRTARAYTWGQGHASSTIGVAGEYYCSQSSGDEANDPSQHISCAAAHDFDLNRSTLSPYGEQVTSNVDG